jgi:hypothetical protein
VARTFSGRRQGHRVSQPSIRVTLYLRRPWPLKPKVVTLTPVNFSLGGLGIEIDLALREDSYILMDIDSEYHRIHQLPCHILYCSTLKEGWYRCGIQFVLTNEKSQSLNREALHLLGCIEKHQQQRSACIAN